MKWCETPAKKGDMVRVKMGEIYHYGIFVSCDEVIQFGLAPVARSFLKDSELEVCVTDVDGFLCGGVLETGFLEETDDNKRSAEEIVSLARSKIGQKGYNVIHNNCEHFAHECYFGVKKCTQADFIRNMFRSRPLLDVYYAVIPRDFSITAVTPEVRDEEIKSCTDEKVKKEKFFAWKLLAHALYRSLGLRIENLEFNKDKNGKWLCDKCFFSISHGDGIVAIAVSKQSVGIDLELIDDNKKQVLEKVLTEIEKAELSKGESSIEKLTTIWTKKESIYKMKGEGAFSPRKIESLSAQTFSKILAIDGKNFALSVCSNDLTPLRFFENVALG